MTISRHLLLQARKSGHSGGGVAAVETFEKYHAVNLAGKGNYVPGDAGLFSASLTTEDLQIELQDSGASWRTANARCNGNNSIVGDGTNLRFFNNNVGAQNLTVMRHHLSTGTYERYNTQDLGAGATYTPGDEGLFSHASEDDEVDCEYKYNAAWWYWTVNDAIGVEKGTCLGIGDGSRLRYNNTNGGAARFVVIMRFLPGTAVNTFERYHVEDLANLGTYVPADDGLYSASLETEDLDIELLDGNAVWQDSNKAVTGNNCIIGDGTHLRFFQGSGGARNLVVMRHHISTGTYEMYHTENLPAATRYIPADEGLFSHAAEANAVPCEYKYNAAWRGWRVNSGGGGEYGTQLSIGDGANMGYDRIGGGEAWIVIMRHIMVT